MADIRPTKSRSISSLVVLLIVWSLYLSEVISRPEPENKWYNIGPQSNQSINKVVIIANITPPTNGPTPPQPPLTPPGRPLQPSNSAKPTTKPVQHVTPSQKEPQTPSSNINVTSTNTSANSSPPAATPSKSTAAGQSAESINMTDIKSVGCFRDSYMAPRPLPKLIADFRDDSEHGKQRQDYNDTILACAKKAAEMKFGFFGIQSNGECWSGEDSEKTFSRDGPSTDCHHGVGSSGSNFVYRFVGKHSKPCRECGSARNMCFPASAQLQLHNGLRTTMENLRVGDKIQTIDISTNQLISTEVIAFLHKNEETDGLYMLLRLEDGVQIALSERHLIYAAKTNQSDAVSVVYAEDVIPGDFVRVSGQANTMGQVIRVSTLTNKGEYAPMTRHGTMLVDGILVSCYAHWRSHDIAHKVMAPLRIWFDITSTLGDILSGANEMPSGIHWYASLLVNFSQSLPSSFAEYMGN